jgi:hypothetical protein
LAELFLTLAKARYEYACGSCQRPIHRGSAYYRHDPYPSARMHRGEQRSHWCYECVSAAAPVVDTISGRLRVSLSKLIGVSSPNFHEKDSILLPVHFEIVSVSQVLSERLAVQPDLVHDLNPVQFEDFVCERLFAMGLEPKRVGDSTFRKDGGIDLVFWPRERGAFPFLGAAQLKHRRDPRDKVGPAVVRDFAGVMAAHPFNAGIIVTNALFSPDAVWFAQNHARLIRLRDFGDIRRWLSNNFTDELERREIPPVIEVCPGVIVKIRPERQHTFSIS